VDFEGAVAAAAADVAAETAMTAADVAAEKRRVEEEIRKMSKEKIDENLLPLRKERPRL